MATVIGNMAEAENGTAYVRAEYDDVTLVVAAVRYANLSTKPVLAFVTAQDGTALLAPQTIQPNTDERRQSIPVAKRWHYGGTDAPLVNLAS